LDNPVKDTTRVENYFKILAKPISVGDSIMFIPKLIVRRIDLNTIDAESYILIPHSRLSILELLKEYSSDSFIFQSSDLIKTITKEASVQSDFKNSDFEFLVKVEKFEGFNKIESIDSLRSAIGEVLARDFLKNKVIISFVTGEDNESYYDPFYLLDSLMNKGDWPKAVILAHKLSIYENSYSGKTEEFVSKGDVLFFNLKKLGRSGAELIDIPMGYYTVAYELSTNDSEKKRILEKYTTCKVWLSGLGIEAKGLPIISN
jgi:hypothetical protein